MSGHSKWATIKRAKGAADAKRGKLFSVLSKDITLAARDGGGDPGFNPRLRTCIAKAKAANMPADNVERAIKKGTGELPGVVYEEVLYEGYGAGGVGVIVEITTDNKNRSASEVRSTMGKNGGNLAGVGAVAFQFDRKGQMIIEASATDEETLMEITLEAGAEDILNEADHFEVICPISEYDAVSQALTDKGIETVSSELAYLPNVEVPVTDKDTARKVLHLVEKLEDLEDVKAVHHNMDLADGLLEEAES
ncbi:MAG: YebC/PmpR family DNA-binding transcriptional regulator [Puniceicoccaceae bacterium MED-G30]|jgi:YebC/PmpR family DNA-binding regulatory protein|nr:MAG: YebC/PmpR family DNA-binding transcriptional regulator [Puniceicoccaceae bacterium MED-G30]RPG84834.1 MAG: YebC/PmpR family DNA-binding transcriptional regulator [Coraliomargarita sp. TMED73]|tara:strand:- start:1823 stop:2575 length:753 start_codon:yes stop_codon:yes gene_type:complete